MKTGESDEVRGMNLNEEDDFSQGFSPDEMEAECVLVDMYEMEETDEEADDRRFRDTRSDSRNQAPSMIPFLLIGLGLTWLVSNAYARRE